MSSRIGIAALLLLFSLGQALAAPPTRTVTDMAGRQVRVPPEIRRVVTAGGTPAINAFLVALGRSGLIVNGLPQPMRGRWKLQQLFVPAANGPVVSGMGPSWTPDLEALRALPHDLVLVDNEQTARMLERRGFTTFCLLWKGPDSVPATMRVLGDLLNRREQAAAYERYYQKNLERVRAEVGALPAEQRPRALFCRLEPLSLPMVSTARMLIERSGGRYAAVGTLPADHATITLETLLVWNPDLLFVWSPEDVTRAYTDQRFASLRAVKQRRVFAVPMGLHLWSNYTPEQAPGILWMAKMLYPDRFQQLSPSDETMAFYRQFCSKQLSNQQISTILLGR